MKLSGRMDLNWPDQTLSKSEENNTEMSPFDVALFFLNSGKFKKWYPQNLRTEMKPEILMAKKFVHSGSVKKNLKYDVHIIVVAKIDKSGVSGKLKLINLNAK
jgi:hypothetical protein